MREMIIDQCLGTGRAYTREELQAAVNKALKSRDMLPVNSTHYFEEQVLHHIPLADGSPYRYIRHARFFASGTAQYGKLFADGHDLHIHRPVHHIPPYRRLSGPISSETAKEKGN